MVYRIDRKDLWDLRFLEKIYRDMEHDYYWSDDFSEAMYLALANAGFISVSLEYGGSQLLLGEIQRAYALLRFDEMHVSKKVAKLLRGANYRLAFNTAFDDVVRGIQASHDACWMVGKYETLMRRLNANSSEAFRLFSVELFDEGTGTLVAGEIGYITANNVYTSLSGFHSAERRYSSWGTLQLVLLGRHLQKAGLRFWNLGHPYMKYKSDLGAVVVPRRTFLKLWYPRRFGSLAL
ncbi:leucyl/phenylalanyl-tRNA--protein transferase family protein [Sulfurimonas sp. HSL-3221]|uniref:GNAT family N-acetyltransferase n=1 Tax=Sulfurimonadaceae TaxID=2771471 RepID=UPI001E5520BB|nr:GNAT family N-acetyltransferase [Sulfurimonas sp. HSL-3221]UFS62763.1 leucyl/phenylalanyl-tRNA--protein transferase family protein [Sulfurimonas sp. HSL-3221]